MGSDISGSTGAIKKLAVKATKTAMDICCIISLWLSQMIFKLENNLKMAILHSHKRKAPCIYSIGPESSSQIPEKRPRYMLLTTNVAQPKKNAITKTAPSLDLLFYSRLRKSNQRYTLLLRQNVYPHFWFLGSPAHFALSPFLR